MGGLADRVNGTSGVPPTPEALGRNSDTARVRAMGH